jgi:hypothetical protein
MPKNTAIVIMIAVIIAREVALSDNPEVLGFGFPTKIGAPVKTEAGIVQDTMSGAVNVVPTDVQVLFQYAMTLVLLKLGLEKLTVPETSELKASPFEVTSMV